MIGSERVMEPGPPLVPHCTPEPRPDRERVPAALCARSAAGARVPLFRLLLLQGRPGTVLQLPCHPHAVLWAAAAGTYPNTAMGPTLPIPSKPQPYGGGSYPATGLPKDNPMDQEVPTLGLCWVYCHQGLKQGQDKAMTWNTRGWAGRGPHDENPPVK
ncbi:uncharacterized protein [Melopsittacus undulatus]|uniref:uncharacterized protein isoform X4 n=1 Tax=Melopsittacus undulatus TaxID=13146 RepID=UPI00146CE84B|nr:uncharacterized protein LOC117437368 isoform X4 [Melopsittacus undulatus]